MAKIYTAKEMAKMILNEPKDFNLDNFCKTEVSTFFERILEYLKTHSKPYQSHFLKQTKCMNPTNILESIKKIEPKLNPLIMENVSLEVVARCFTYFLHPETPESVRTRCVQSYLNILGAVKPEEIPRFDEANVCIIPFNRYSRTHTENVNFEKYITMKNQPIVIYEEPQGLQSDCIVILEKTYQWVVQNWAYGKTEICAFLFRYIFSVIYHQIALDAGYTETQYGFENPVIEIFHEKTLCFFSSFFEIEGLDIQPMFETKVLMTMMIHILEVTQQYNNPNNAITTIDFYTKIVTNSELVDHLLTVDKDLFLTIPFTAINIAEMYIQKSCTANQKEKVIDALLKFLIACYTMIYSKLGEEIYTYLFSLFDKFKNNLRIVAFMFAAFVQRLITIKEDETAPWSFLMELTKNNDVLSAIACKYAQMVAVMQLPILLDIQQLDDAISFCSSFYSQRVKNVIPEKYDFFIENLDNIIDFPNVIVMEKLKSMWSPLDSFDNTLRGVPLPSPPISSLCEEDFGEISSSFITPFDIYSSETDPDVKRRLFAPILTYYNTLQELSVVPPGLECKQEGIFAFSRKRLFTAILNEKDPLIVGGSSECMNAMLSHANVIPKVDAESLSSWYTAIILLLNNADEKLVNIGINAIYTAFKFNMTGVTCLLPTFIALLEGDLVKLSSYAIDIISSFPLLEVDHVLPKVIQDNIVERINANRDMFKAMAVSVITKPGTNLRKRVIDYIFKKIESKDMSDPIYDFNILLRAIQPLLVDEISQENPSNETLGKALTAIYSACKCESQYAVGIIRSETMMIPKIAEIAPQEMKEFISSMAAITKDMSSFSNDWSIQFIEVVTVLFIYNFDLMKNEASYKNFVSNIYKISSQKVNSQSIDNNNNDLIEAATSMLKMLSIYFGAFPFHNTVSYPTSKFDVAEKENTISTRTGNILELSSTDDNATIASQTPVGRFVWEMTPVSHEFYKEEQAELATLPSDSATPSNEFDKQIALQNNAEPLIKSFEEELGEIPFFSIPEDEADEEEKINEILNKFKETEEPEIAPVRPPMKMENIKAGALTSTGIYRPSHPHDIKDISVDQFQIFLHNLNTTNHRILQKFGVLFISSEIDVEDYISILDAQIEETSPQFREFIHTLGWAVDMKTYGGYDGELDIEGDRTGDYSIYYADFAREAVFHIPALFKKNLTDQSQNYRKRFISNDNVVIVWNENKAPFDPTIVYQKQNLLFVVLTQMDTNTIKVDLITRSGFTLSDGRNDATIYLSKEQLPSFIRSTCIIAQERSTRSNTAWKHPVSEIISTLSEVTTGSHSSSKNIREFVSMASVMSTRSKESSSEQIQVSQIDK